MGVTAASFSARLFTRRCPEAARSRAPHFQQEMRLSGSRSAEASLPADASSDETSNPSFARPSRNGTTTFAPSGGGSEAGADLGVARAVKELAREVTVLDPFGTRAFSHAAESVTTSAAGRTA